jgi:hypothetical protein
MTMSEFRRLIQRCFAEAGEGHAARAYDCLWRAMTDVFPTSEQWRKIVDAMHFMEVEYCFPGF